MGFRRKLIVILSILMLIIGMSWIYTWFLSAREMDIVLEPTDAFTRGRGFDAGERVDWSWESTSPVSFQLTESIEGIDEEPRTVIETTGTSHEGSIEPETETFVHLHFDNPGSEELTVVLSWDERSNWDMKLAFFMGMFLTAVSILLLIYIRVKDSDGDQEKSPDDLPLPYGRRPG
jgi:hypothetical protein